MKVAGTMIGVTGGYTFSAVAYKGGDGRFHCAARAFDHPDPAVTLPSGTAARHVVTAEGASLDGAIKALEEALAARLGPLQWVRWRLTDDEGSGRA
ncbi:MAG TPA: hypothetical protein VLC73_00680 [Burkholderiales bacterium]|nr:hypothetical protein [Burkholderiales bacterium]